MITSKDNKWLKLIRDIRRGKIDDLWLVEGSRAALEAGQNGLRPLVVLFDRERVSPQEIKLLASLFPQSVVEADGRRLDEVADQDSPRGLLALFPRFPTDFPRSQICPGLYIFADRIQDPKNLGALIRVGVAFGAKAFFVSKGSCSVSHPRVVRASVGLALKASILEQATIDSALDLLAPLSPLVAALDSQGSCPLNQVRFPDTVLLLLGTEGQGLGPDLLRTATLAISIPMSDAVDSLNLATAAAVACYEIWRQTAKP